MDADQIHTAIAMRDAEIARLAFELHKLEKHPDYEYTRVVTQRKTCGPRPEGEGWEVNPIIALGAGVFRGWDRDDFTDTEYWRRKRT